MTWWASNTRRKAQQKLRRYSLSIKINKYWIVIITVDRNWIKTDFCYSLSIIKHKSHLNGWFSNESVLLANYRITSTSHFCQWWKDIYIKKTTSDNTKAFFQILVNFFSCSLTWFASKFKSEIVAATAQRKRKE